MCWFSKPRIKSQVPKRWRCQCVCLSCSAQSSSEISVSCFSGGLGGSGDNHMHDKLNSFSAKQPGSCDVVPPGSPVTCNPHDPDNKCFAGPSPLTSPNPSKLKGRKSRASWTLQVFFLLFKSSNVRMTIIPKPRHEY